MDDEAPEQVDYRFLMANERTYLAYTRTALALQVAGLGILQFLTHTQSSVRYLLGVALVAAGSYLGVAGYRRFRSNERAMRAGHDLGPTRAAGVIAVAVAAVPLLAAAAIALIALF